MTAVAEILEAVEAAGGALAVHGGKLKVTAPAPLPNALVNELRQHKPDILAALSRKPDRGLWGAEDWRAHFHERAAIAEHDGGLCQTQAEAMAYQCCIIEWLNQHFETSPPGVCAWCGDGDSGGGVILSFGSDSCGHTWLHSACWEPWNATRKQTAREALAGFGILASQAET